jgi:hypothetical protein
MVRAAGALFAGLALAFLAVAADPLPAGTWKVIMPTQGGPQPFWIVSFESRGGKWSGSVVATAKGLPRTTLDHLSVQGDILRFDLTVAEETYSVEGKLTPGGDRIRGTVSLRGDLPLVSLERTALTTLDHFEVAREALARQTEPAEVVQTALSLLREAAERKVKPDEVRSWAARASRTSKEYGPRWHRYVLLAVATTLSRQKGFEEVALQYAHEAERLLSARDNAATQKQVLDLLADTLTRAGKDDEAREVRARVKKLDFTIKPRTSLGPKGNRVVLVELFTGSACKPCVAADLAFDALAGTYKPDEVALLRYDLHISAPDPLANPDAEARAGFYGRAVEQVPALLVNGKVRSGGGGSEAEAQEKYDEYLGLIDPWRERPARAALKLTATRKGSRIDIRAEVSDLKETGNDVRLRLALVEEEVPYTGANKLAVHRHLVRAFPGGVDGTALKDSKASKTATVDLEELSKQLKAYLDKVAKKQPFSGKLPPLEFHKLSVVGFVQNDETGEVLQAVQVSVVNSQ